MSEQLHRVRRIHKTVFTMYYDDVDVNILDAKDTFGIMESNVAKDGFGGKVSGKSSFSKPFMKREFNEATNSDSKLQLPSKFSKKNKGADSEICTIESANERKFEGKTIVSEHVEFRYKQAVTFQEKLSVLEDRDRHLRETVFRDASKNMSIIAIGTCPDMCPEKERLLREVHCSFSTFEGQIVQNEMHVVPELLVKEYARSSADQDEPLPHELRPEPVLMSTMTHILANIVPRIEEISVDLSEWYHFCWDRLRSLRKDIIQQQLCSTNIVKILEQSARFHICCADRLFEADRRVFDEKINAENLVNCLQMLITMYEDLEARGQRCENETEFRVYMMLLQLDSGDVPDILRWYDEDGRRRCDEAKQIFYAFKLKLYTRFFKLAKNTDYLTACILQRYFVSVKMHILNVLVNSYSTASQTTKLSLPFVKKILEFDSDEETAAFLESYGFTVNFSTNEIRGSKSTFVMPDMKPVCKSSSILTNKRIPMLEAITRDSKYKINARQNRVHSSFNENDVLKETAWNAEDQREKVIQLYGNIYEISEVESNQEIIDTTEQDSESSETCSRHSAFSEPKPMKLKPVSEPALTSQMPFLPPPTSVFNFGAYHNLSKLEEPKKSSTIFSFKEPSNGTQVQNSNSTALFKMLPEPVKSPVKLKSVPVSSTEAHNESKLSEFFFSSPIKTNPECPAVVNNSEKSRELTEPTVSVRGAEEVADSLSNALHQFEQLYWNYFGITESDRLEIRRFNEKLQNRTLRKIVRRRLKHESAKKVARFWRKKMEIRRQKQENFIGITHMSPYDYFRLWGSVHKDDITNKMANSKPHNIVEEASQAHDTFTWSYGMLNAKSLTVKYVGQKLADIVASSLRAQCAKLRLKTPRIACWKVIVSLPPANNPSSEAFSTKINEFCRSLFCKNENSKLGDVQTTTSAGIRVFSAVNSITGPISTTDVTGVSSLIIYVCDHWETADEFAKRASTLCEELTYRLFVSVILAGDNSFKSEVSRCLSRLRDEKVIKDFTIIKWNSFFTVPKTIFKACQHVPVVVPSFQVKSLDSFIETVGGDFFLNLLYSCKGEPFDNSPMTYIRLYNKFLAKLEKAIAEEDAQRYNLPHEFLPYITDCEKSRNNLTDDEVILMIHRYSLVSFTKWPPKSTQKMITLLTKYCTTLDADGLLLPNILRLVHPLEGVPVEEISQEAPWLKIVELWFRFNAHYVSKNEDAGKLFVFYDEQKIEEICEGLWVHDC